MLQINISVGIPEEYGNELTNWTLLIQVPVIAVADLELVLVIAIWIYLDLDSEKTLSTTIKDPIHLARNPFGVGERASDENGGPHARFAIIDGCRDHGEDEDGFG